MTYGGYAADEATFACMKKAYDLGVNFFDTAENYTAGESEKVMGRAIKHFGWKRSDLVITTSECSCLLLKRKDSLRLADWGCRNQLGCCEW